MNKSILNRKPYFYLFFFILLMLITKGIFVGNLIEWLLSAVRPVIIVLIIIYFLEPLKHYYILKLHIKSTTSVVLTFLSAFLVLLIFIGIVLPSTIKSVDSIINQLPGTGTRIVSYLTTIPFFKNIIDENLLLELVNNFNQYFSVLMENVLSYSSMIIQSVKNIVMSFILFILSILMSFYALRDYEKIWDKIELTLSSLFGEKALAGYIRAVKLTNNAFRKYFVGKLITCVILGILILFFGIIFNIISPSNIPYLPLIAIIIGLTNIIPYVGPLIGTIPSIIFALINGFVPAIALLAIVLVAQQIDNMIITPKIIGDSVGLKPFWVLLSVTIGGKLFGILGMVLMVPVTSVLLNLLEERMEIKREIKRDGSF